MVWFGLDAWPWGLLHEHVILELYLKSEDIFKTGKWPIDKIRVNVGKSCAWLWVLGGAEAAPQPCKSALGFVSCFERNRFIS
jgi:hypothetical protein